MVTFDRGSGPGSDAQARARTRRIAMNLDVASGILGFFTVLAAIQTVVLEVRGESAVVAAIILLVLVSALWLVRSRRKRLHI